MIFAKYQGIDGQAQDKGHETEWKAYYASILGGELFPIQWDDLRETFELSCVIDQH